MKKIKLKMNKFQTLGPFLPTEVRKLIFSYCENDTLYNSMLTCKDFHEDIKNDKPIWQNRTFVVTPGLKFPLTTFQENGIVIKRLIVTFPSLRTDVLNNMNLLKKSNRYEELMVANNLTSLEFYQIGLTDYIKYDHTCFDCVSFIGVIMSEWEKRSFGRFITKKTIVEFKDCTIEGYSRHRITFDVHTSVLVFNNTTITNDFVVRYSHVSPKTEIRFVKSELTHYSMNSLLCMCSNAKSIYLELLPDEVIPSGIRFLNVLRELITRPSVLAFNECMFRHIFRLELPHVEYDKLIYVTNLQIEKSNNELRNVLRRIKTCFPKVNVIHLKNTDTGNMYKCTIETYNISVEKDETKSAIVDMEIVKDDDKQKEYMKLVKTSDKMIRELNVNTENENYNTTIRKIINLVSNKENPMFIKELKNSFDNLKKIIKYENTMDSLQLAYRKQLYMIENIEKVVEIYEALFYNTYTENGKTYIEDLKKYINKIKTVKINTLYNTPSVKKIKKNQINEALEEIPKMVNPITENIDNLYKEAKIPLDCNTLIYEEEDSKYVKDEQGNLEFELDTSQYPEDEDENEDDENDDFDYSPKFKFVDDDGIFEFSTTVELNKNPFSYRNLQKRNNYVVEDEDLFYKFGQKTQGDVRKNITVRHRQTNRFVNEVFLNN